MNNKSFTELCYSQLKKIPRGKVTTYKAIAQALGTNAYRAVGNALNKNPYTPKVPCHRVVKSNGEVGGYAQGMKKKINLLKKEGISVTGNKIDSFNENFFEYCKKSC